MKKILTMFFFLSFLGIGEVHAVKVGDEFTYIHKSLVGGRIIRHRYAKKIINYDPQLEMYLLRTERDYDSDDPQERDDSEIWYKKSDFLSEKTINRILKECKEWGGEKDLVRLFNKNTKETTTHEVCIINKLFGNLAPIDGQIYYYGHFPIFGYVRVDAFDPREVAYDENLVVPEGFEF